MFRPRVINETEEETSTCKEKVGKSLKQKRNAKSQGSTETQRQNAKNAQKTLNGDVKNEPVNHGVITGQGSRKTNLGEKHAVRKSAVVKEENGSENSGHGDRRRKKKEKQYVGNELRASANGQERRVIVNGNGQEAGRYVEHTRGARLPVREEAEPRLCGEECPPKESQTQCDTQGRKSKSRKKKKSGLLGKDFTLKDELNVLMRTNFIIMVHVIINTSVFV